MPAFQTFISFITVLFSGLVAGLLYSYSCSVNPGLKALPDKEYLGAMQSINRAIQNPVFFISFMGLLVLLPLFCWLAYKQGAGISFSFVFSATLIYYTGVFGISIFGNIPLNNQLENFNIVNAGAEEMLNMRSRFENTWVRWHTVRTIAAILSFGILLFGLLKKNVL